MEETLLVQATADQAFLAWGVHLHHARQTEAMEVVSLPRYDPLGSTWGSRASISAGTTHEALIAALLLHLGSVPAKARTTQEQESKNLIGFRLHLLQFVPI